MEMWACIQQKRIMTAPRLQQYEPAHLLICMHAIQYGFVICIPPPSLRPFATRLLLRGALGSCDGGYSEGRGAQSCAA
jgi:hypothetical protein